MNQANKRILGVGAVIFIFYLVFLPGAVGQTQWTANFGDGPDYLRARLVDWDNDGTLDVVATTEKGIEVYDGADGSLKWQLNPSRPGTNWISSGPFGFREASFGRNVPADLDGDGSPDILVVGSTYDNSDDYWFQVSNCIQLYDINTRTLKWQKDGIMTDFETLVLSIGNTDTDKPFEAAFFTAGYDLEINLYTNRTLTVLDLAEGRVQWATSFGDGPERLRVSALIDWENDGALDVVVKTASALRVFNGSAGGLKWVLAPAMPAADWEIFSYSGLKELDLGRRTPADLTGDGTPDISLVLGKSFGGGQYVSRIEVYDVASKALQWQSPTNQGIAGFRSGNLDGDLPYEFALLTRGYDSGHDLYTNRVLTVLDGAAGAVQWTHDFGDGAAPLDPQYWDWDNDGILDILVRSETTMEVYNGADGTLKWQMPLRKPGPDRDALGPYPWKEQGFDLITPTDLDGDGQPDFMLTWRQTGSSPASTILQVYDINGKALKWQTEISGSAYVSGSIIPSVGNIDADPAYEIVVASSEIDETSGRYTNRVLKVIDASGLPPTLLNPTHDGNSFSALVQTVNGKEYTLEFKAALEATAWSSSARVTGDGFVKSLADPSASGVQRFYRVRVD